MALRVFRCGTKRPVSRRSIVTILAASTTLVYLFVLLYTGLGSLVKQPQNQRAIVSVKTKEEDVSWIYNLRPR